MISVTVGEDMATILAIAMATRRDMAIIEGICTVSAALGGRRYV